MARPHGQPLTDWHRQDRPITATLAVLAELLAFIEQVHAERLLLHGMGPASILIDQAERVHYVGTDMVMARQGIGQRDLPALWAKLFPAERFPRGFSPPECFAGAGGPALTGPDRASDLYAWGSLAYFLLTDLSPAQIALDQGRSWAHFQDAHFARLEKVLSAVSSAHAQSWLQQLGLSLAAAKSIAWPGGFISLMRLLLHPDLRRRPGNVADLRRWLVAPPPPMVAALLALRTGPSEARILVDQAGLDPKTQSSCAAQSGTCPPGRTMATWFWRAPARHRFPTSKSRQPGPFFTLPSLVGQTPMPSILPCRSQNCSNRRAAT